MYSTVTGEIQAQHATINTLHPLSSTVEEGWWFGPVLQPQDLGILQLLTQLQTPL